MKLIFYDDKVKKSGGWTGWRPFTVKDRVNESEEITSFYLYPTDGGKIAEHLPGQYISVRLFLQSWTCYNRDNIQFQTLPMVNIIEFPLRRKKAVPIQMA
ncbi:hypothetical protein [Sphingobacterium daejeonense]|uniref:hypothetical protein n=1 Tax=Sphingobacterium daejeonense TaxID=371142 RepID=UPI0018D86859|nr:hypothetical protein [Sphingobacterium daejeonense]